MTAPITQSSDAKALNPDLKPRHDATYDETQNGSTPLDTISVKKNGPAIWPAIWAISTIVLGAIAIFLLVG
jgi:hypothetical protein